MRPEVGQLIGEKYRLTRLIGEGGMGSVFEATHELLGSRVALKFLNPDLANNAKLVARFMQEARVSAKLRSPHVVQVSDVDQTSSGLPYLVMELLEGESLQSCMHRQHTLPVATAVQYTLQILDGLEEAHKHGIVHRDLKPDNVFVVASAQGPLLKLLDFGIAKLRNLATDNSAGLTRPGALLGTPHYMAPEQAFGGANVDPRADLFSVGVILFEMIAGCRPVEATDARGAAAMVVSGQTARLSDVASAAPPLLSDVVAKALSGDPRDRYQTTVEFRTALSPFVYGPMPIKQPNEASANLASTEPISPQQALAAVSAMSGAAGAAGAAGSIGTAPSAYGAGPSFAGINSAVASPAVAVAFNPAEQNLGYGAPPNNASMLPYGASYAPPDPTPHLRTGTVLGGEASIPYEDYAPRVYDANATPDGPPMVSQGFSTGYDYRASASMNPGVMAVPVVGGSPGAAGVGGVGNVGHMAAPQFLPPTQAPTMRAKRSSFWPMAIVIVTILCIGGAGIGGLTWWVIKRRATDDTPPFDIPSVTTLTTATGTAAATPTTPTTYPTYTAQTTPTTPTTTRPANTTRPTNTTRPPAVVRDAGVSDGSAPTPADAGRTPGIVFPPLPSSLPPFQIPSNFPTITLPSGFPPITLPGWGQPTQQEAQPQ